MDKQTRKAVDAMGGALVVRNGENRWHVAVKDGGEYQTVAVFETEAEAQGEARARRATLKTYPAYNHKGQVVQVTIPESEQ